MKFILKFTFNKAVKKKVREVKNCSTKGISTTSFGTIPWSKVETFYCKNDKVYVRGGRSSGLKILKEYATSKNIIIIEIILHMKPQHCQHT